MQPRDCGERVERVGHKVGDVAEGEPVVLSLGYKILFGFCRCLWVFLGVHHFQVAVKHQKACGDGDEKQSEQEVLHEKRYEFRGANSLFLDEQVVLAAALVAVDALVANDVRRLAVRVHALARALARLAELRRHLQVLQVRQLQHQVLLHLGEELGEGALWHAPDDVLLLVEVKRLLAAAQLADLALLIIFLLALQLALEIVLVLTPALILLVKLGAFGASSTLRPVGMHTLPSLVLLLEAAHILRRQDGLAL